MNFKEMFPFVVGNIVIIGVLMLGSTWYGTMKKNAFLEVQVQVTEAQITSLRQHQTEMDKAIAALMETKKSIDSIKADLRNTVRKAMKDETYKIWAESLVHPLGIGVLREAADRYGVGAEQTTGGVNNGVQQNSPPN